MKRPALLLIALVLWLFAAGCVYYPYSDYDYPEAEYYPYRGDYSVNFGLYYPYWYSYPYYNYGYSPYYYRYDPWWRYRSHYGPYRWR